MAKLSEEVKRYIVMQFAAFETPQKIADAVRAEFGVEMSRQQANDYNPEARHKAPVAKKWQELFAQERHRYLTEVEDIPGAHKAFRLRQLNAMAMRAAEKGNYPLAAQLLEQMSKEMGGAFTNRRELTGKDGGPISTRNENVSVEQIDRELLEMLGYNPDALDTDAPGGS